MLRQRSSEVMDRTFYRPPYYALHVGLRGVGADGLVGENCIVNMANQLTDEECKYGAKKQRKLRGGGCIFNSEWARTFPGIRASNQSAANA